MARYERNPGASYTGASGKYQSWQTDDSPNYNPNSHWRQILNGLAVGEAVLVRGFGSGEIIAAAPSGYIVRIKHPAPGQPTRGLVVLVTDRAAIERLPSIPPRLRQVWP